MDPNERQILRAFAAHPTSQGFSSVLDRYLPLVYAAAARQTSDPAQALAAARLAFVTLARRARSLRRRTVLGVWLFDATRLAVRALGKSRGAHGSASENSQVQEAPPVIQPLARSLLAANLDAAIARLKPRLRAAFLLRFLTQWPLEEAASLARTGPRRLERRARKTWRKVQRRVRRKGAEMPTDPASLVASEAICPSVPVEVREIILAAVLEPAAPRSQPLVQVVGRGLSWLRWKRRLKLAGAAAGSGLLLLAGLAGTLVVLWNTGRLLPLLIELGAWHQARQVPELAEPARPWPAGAPVQLPGAALVGSAADLYRVTNIWQAHLKFSQSEWAALTPKRVPPVPKLMQPDGTIVLRNPKASRSGLAGAIGYDFPWTAAGLEFSGTNWSQVACRYRGNGTYLNSLYGMKRPFKIDLNRFVKSQKLAGVTTLNLANLTVDASNLSDALGYELFRRAGVPAPRTAYAWVTLTVAGEKDRVPLGLYLLLEDLDSRFAKETFGEKGGAIFKPVTYDLFQDLGDDWAAYEPIYDPKTKVTAEQKARLFGLSRLLTHGSDAEFAERIGDFLDLEEFARFLGGLVMLSSYDGFLSNGQNFYIYLDPRSQKFGFIPWDLDNAWGSFPFVGTREMREQASIWKPWTSRNRLLERVMKVEAFREIYRRALEEYLAEWFVPERLEQRIDEVAGYLRGPIAAESSFRLRRFEQAISTVWVEPGPGPQDGPARPVHQLKRFIRARAQSVRDQLDGKSPGVQLSGMGQR